MGDESDHRDHAGEEGPSRNAKVDGPVPQSHPKALQKQDHLNTFPVEGGEAEQSHAEHELPWRVLLLLILEQLALPAVVKRDPSRPVHLMKKPVHDDQQHDDSQEPCRRLKLKGGNLTANVFKNPNSTQPGHDRGQQTQASTIPDVSSVFLLRPA